MTTDTEEPCCVWCEGPIRRTALLRRRHRSGFEPDLCLKCTLWALMGQKPPYIVTPDQTPRSSVPARSHEWSVAHPPS